MADNNITIKRVTGSGTSDNLYPRTVWDQVLNKPTTFTPTSHTHTLANITDSGAAAAKGIVDSASPAAIGTGTSLPTERDVYYGLVAVNGSSQTRSTTIYAPTSAGSSYQTLRSSGSGAPVWVESFEEIGSTSTTVNNYGSISFTSGMRNFYVEVQQDGTTGLYQIAKFMVTMENSYSLSTSSRYYRATWFNGGSALTITFQYYYSGTTFYIRHTGSTVTLGYRLYNVKQVNMIVYFRVKDKVLVGMSKYPYEEQDGFITVEKDIEPEKFSMGTDIFVYKYNDIKEVPPPTYDEEGNKL